MVKRVHRKVLAVPSLFLIMFLINPCSANEKETFTFTDLARENNVFACRLFRQIGGTDENFVLSPYSISTALAMTYAGARKNTEKQMAQVLHFHTDQARFHNQFSTLQNHLRTVSQKGNIVLNWANSLWLQKGYNLKRGYVSIIRDLYNSEIREVNFANPEKPRLEINAWVEDRTKNKIRELIKPGFIDMLTRLVLVNAIYFKGDWEKKFRDSFTQNKTFYCGETDSMTVSMMHQEEKFIYLQDSVCQVIEMPYRGGELSMVILLPQERDGLSDLEKSLTGANLTRWTTRGMERRVAVFLPRFSMASSFFLGEILAAMGMPDAFSERADFSGMAGKDEVRISEVIHKAYITVDEKGSEAAAATAVIKRGLYMPEPPVDFRVDHPFIFMIRDNYSGSILFLGKIIRPIE